MVPFTVAVTVTTVAPASSATVLGVPEVEPLVSTLSVMPLGAASSSLMVPVASAVAIVPPTAPVSSTRKVAVHAYPYKDDFFTAWRALAPT